MKSNKGVTLLELLIAISLLLLVIMGGSSIYLSGMNLSMGTQGYAQAQRNADIVLLHIDKYARHAASEFYIDKSGYKVRFLVYDSNNLDSAPETISQYEFLTDQGQVIYTPDTSSPNTFTVISDHIVNCSFSVVHKETDGIVLYIEVTATDNKGDLNNSYTLRRTVEATLTASPGVYTIPEGL